MSRAVNFQSFYFVHPSSVDVDPPTSLVTSFHHFSGFSSPQVPPSQDSMSTHLCSLKWHSYLQHTLNDRLFCDRHHSWLRHLMSISKSACTELNSCLPLSHAYPATSTFSVYICPCISWWFSILQMLSQLVTHNSVSRKFPPEARTWLLVPWTPTAPQCSPLVDPV